MPDIINKAIGVYHFLSDRVPDSIPLVEPRPRMVNPWLKDGKAIVAHTIAGEDIRTSMDTVTALLGGLNMAINRGDSVLVKPNFNSADPPPASTDPSFLRAVVEILKDCGARVTVGESAGGIWRPTKNVFDKLKLYELARQLNVELVGFEERVNDWVRIKVNGDYLKAITMPRSAYEADKIVYLPCMKTHQLARYTGALKLAVGFMHPGERRSLHRGNLEQKVAEISLCWQPHLILMDGRKVFVSVGPDKGRLEKPGVILASGDLVAIDVEAMKILLSYNAANRLNPDPWKSLQIVTALKHGLGVGEGGYTVIRK